MRYAKSKATRFVTPTSSGLTGLARLLARQAAREVIAFDAAPSSNSKSSDGVRKKSGHPTPDREAAR